MIPVFEPQIGCEEIAEVVAALERGEISGSFGDTIPRFEREFAKICGVKHGIAVTSGTTALHLAVSATGIGPGDEVLVSSSTNIATALAVVHNGAMPVPVDSEPHTFNLDLDLVEGLITPRTRGIIPVHLFGHPVDMHRLMDIAKRHQLIVIEDCAESHGATVRGQMTGSFGEMACFSFYANKIITTGEGGMVLTSDDALAEKLRLLRNLAFTQPRFRHELLGYNFRMTGLQAALALPQLRRFDWIVEQKRRVAATYNQALSGFEGLQLPTELSWAKNVYWMYAVLVRSEFGIARNQLMDRLKNDSVGTRTFFLPMNQQPCLQALAGFRDDPCPVADSIWQTGLYLPSSLNLSEDDIHTVCRRIRAAARP